MSYFSPSDIAYIRTFSAVNAQPSRSELYHWYLSLIDRDFRPSVSEGQWTSVHHSRLCVFRVLMNHLSDPEGDLWYLLETLSIEEYPAI